LMVVMMMMMSTKLSQPRDVSHVISAK